LEADDGSSNRRVQAVLKYLQHQDPL
jgi:hypothetical protein